MLILAIVSAIAFLFMTGRAYSYLNSVKKILDIYTGQQPFSVFIKEFFRQNKKYGSTDRKQISHLCYCYFRLGKAALELDFDKRILLGLFLCSHESNSILKELKPEWDDLVKLNSHEKFTIVGGQLAIEDIFPRQELLSNRIDKNAFVLSHLQQPQLFLRLRPGHEESVKNNLSDAGISFNVLNESCLELPNRSKVEGVIELDKAAVIQDYNSQQTGEFIKSGLAESLKDWSGPAFVWDCCAGSGGKSILAYDLIPKINLTVSDIRESILINLKKRFEKAGIKKYKSFVANHLTLNQHPVPSTQHPIPSTYDLIILDAPCTGSGTWSRTPEQLFYFNPGKIVYYSTLQKNIASNVIPYLKDGASLVYITCSVFKEENELIAEYIQQHFHLEVEKIQLLKGYNMRADSLFVAVFKKYVEC